MRARPADTTSFSRSWHLSTSDGLASHGEGLWCTTHFRSYGLTGKPSSHRRGPPSKSPLTESYTDRQNRSTDHTIHSGYYQPEIYEDGTLELLKGSSANATHYKVTALAKGFSSWTDFDGNPTNLDGSGQVGFAYAYSGTPVDEPENEGSTFSIHDSVGRWVHDLAAARSEEFPNWVSENSLSPLAARSLRGIFANSTAPAYMKRSGSIRRAQNATVVREERHPIIPQLRDSAKFKRV